MLYILYYIVDIQTEIDILKTNLRKKRKEIQKLYHELNTKDELLKLKEQSAGLFDS